MSDMKYLIAQAGEMIDTTSKAMDLPRRKR